MLRINFFKIKMTVFNAAAQLGAILVAPGKPTQELPPGL